MKVIKSFKMFESKGKKNFYVLVGPPSVGKTTWIKNEFRHGSAYVISRDDLVNEVAEKYGWSYNDMFKIPPERLKKGIIDSKYGEVIDSPKSVTWSPLSYSKVVQANIDVANLLNTRVMRSIGRDNIIIDMTNMNVDNRRGSLGYIKGHEDEYNKIAVVFKFKGHEQLIKKVATKRAEELKKLGKSKTISNEVFDMMFDNYEDVTEEEGFDEIIYVNTISELEKNIKN